ncbi:MAG: PAS domain S-box protein [Ramlibacter sp.]|nr:PAS domain S-box protein [Ramlibacter sp.]
MSSRVVALVLMALAVVPLLLVLAIAWQVQQRKLTERAAADIAALASLLAAGQAQSIEGTRQLLLTVSAATPVMAGDWPACNQFMQRLNSRLPNYVSMGVIDLDGMLACRSMLARDPVNLGDRDYFRRVLQGASFTAGHYVVGRVTGNKTMPLAAPVKDSNGVLRGVAFVGLDLGQLEQRLRAVPLAAGMSAWVTDGQGVVLASTLQGPRGTGGQVTDETLAGQLASGRAGPLATQGPDGRAWLHHVVPIAVAGTTGLQVAVSADLEVMIGPPHDELAYLMAALLGLILLLAAILSYVGRNWLLLPLDDLAQSMRQMALRGQRGPRVPRAGRVREIRMLQRGLDAMWAGLARRAQQRDDALAESQKAHDELNAVLNQMADGFLVLDAGWHIKFCNRRAAELVLSDVESLDGRHFWSLFPDDRSRQIRSACEQAVRDGLSFESEEYHAHYKRWFEIHVFASKGSTGVFLRDSTPHWEMIDELRERERRYRELFEANPNVMWIFDTQTLEFLAVNAAAQRRYGYTEAEFLSMRATDIRPEEDREQFVEYVNHASSSASLQDEPGIWRHLTRSGELLLVDVTHHAITFKGRPARLVMAADVTSRLAAESRLRDKLDKLAHHYGEATSALKASRQIVSGYIRTLTEDILPTLRRVAALDSTSPHDLERLRRKGARMAGMLEEVLRLTQIGRAPFEREAVDLSALALQILGALQERDPQRTVHVEVEPGLYCDCDQALVRLLLQALLGNAWKFTAQSPSAWIRVGRVPSTGDDDSVPAWFVSDNGVGFEGSDEERLFVPFMRLHSRGEFPGLGLGLATARAVVARHGGRIWARSTPGQGATFTFELETKPVAGDLLVSEVVIESLPAWDD